MRKFKFISGLFLILLFPIMVAAYTIEGDLVVNGDASVDTVDVGGKVEYSSDAITVDTGGGLDVNLGTAAGDNFTVDTNSLVIEGNTGDIGIGTASPDTTLHIYNGDSGIDPVSNTGLTLESSGDQFVNILSGTGNTGYVVFGDSGDNDIGWIGYIHTINAMTFSTNTAQRMTIDSSGNIGIGTNTPVSSILSGATTLEIESSNAGEIAFDHTDAGTGSDLGSVGFLVSNDRLAHIRAKTDGASDSAFISFHTQPTGGSFADINSNERMRITSAGLVGIGTSTPSHLLHLKSSSPWIQFEDSDDSQKYRIGNANGKLYFYDQTDSRVDMVIDGDGNVGIGSESPTTKLQVAGTVYSTTGGFKFPDGTTQTTAASGTGGLSKIYDASTYTGTDTAKIQQAINDATTNNGAVYIPGGTWNLTDADGTSSSDKHALLVTSGMHIFGSGQQQTILNISDSDTDIFYCNNPTGSEVMGSVTFDNLFLQCSATTPVSGSNGITLDDYSQGGAINSCSFYDLYTGVYSKNASNNSINDCYVTGSKTMYGVVINNTVVTDSGATAIIGNTIANSKTGGANIFITSGGGNRITGNSLQLSDVGVLLSATSSTNTSVLLINSNHIEDHNAYGIKLTGTGGVYQKVLITNNEFCGDCGSHTSVGTYINGSVDSTFESVIIQGNIWHGGGIDIGNCTNVSITGNLINKGYVSRTYGINFFADPAGQVIMGGNLFTGFTTNVGGTSYGTGAAIARFDVGNDMSLLDGSAYLKHTAPGVWLDETGTSYGAYCVLDAGVLQFQKRNIDFGTFVSQMFQYTLASNTFCVTGNITATGTVTGSTACDYVFEDGYVLPSISEMKDHIERYNKLPGLEYPDGVNINDLMEKTEEQALYIIELYDRIVSLEEKLNGMETRLLKLEGN